MAQTDERAAASLSGAWRGVFSYPRLYRPPVDFSADLVEGDGGWLLGATEEKGIVGDALGLSITATLQGRRTGLSVTWLKLYDAAWRYYDCVHYQGILDRSEERRVGKECW